MAQQMELPATFQDRRKTKNILTDPGVQIRFGFYGVFLAVVFSIAMMISYYLSLETFGEILTLATTHRGVATEGVYEEFLRESTRWMIVLIAGYALVSLVFFIAVTHRFVGPQVAIRRHINDLIAGNFSARVSLRKDDAFQDIASDLNQLSQNLEKRYGSASSD